MATIIDKVVLHGYILYCRFGFRFQAMVTFRDASSCRPCVDAFRDSKKMRAKFVGSQKDPADNDNNNDNETASSEPLRQVFSS